MFDRLHSVENPTKLGSETRGLSRQNNSETISWCQQKSGLTDCFLVPIKDARGVVHTLTPYKSAIGYPHRRKTMAKPRGQGQPAVNLDGLSLLPIP